MNWTQSELDFIELNEEVIEGYPESFQNIPDNGWGNLPGSNNLSAVSYDKIMFMLFYAKYGAKNMVLAHTPITGGTHRLWVHIQFNSEVGPMLKRGVGYGQGIGLVFQRLRNFSVMKISEKTLRRKLLEALNEKQSGEFLPLGVANDIARNIVIGEDLRGEILE